jgi:hypothetical protein
MFNCETCFQSVGPNVAPVKVVVKTREKIYERIISDEEKVTSKGSEIEEERLICPECAGQKPQHKGHKVDPVHLPDQPLAPTFKMSIAAAVFNNAVDRNRHNSKRGKRDFKATYEHLSGYANRGGGL